MDHSRRRSRGDEFEKRVAEILRKNAIAFSEKVAFRGVRVNFLIGAPDGRSIVVEAKSWSTTKSNLNRAIEQVRLYRGALGADEAIVVLEGLDRGRPGEGVVSERELIRSLSATLQLQPPLPGEPSRFSLGKQLGQGAFGTTYLVTREPQRTIFAAMPFSGDYDDTYFVAMAYAAESVGAVCERVDHEDFQGDVVDEIKRLIHRSVAVISDLSESKPNVLYETGFAHALSLPTVHICSTPLSQLPFDVRNWNTIEYSKGQTHSLRNVLAKRLAGLLKDKTARK